MSQPALVGEWGIFPYQSIILTYSYA